MGWPTGTPKGTQGVPVPRKWGFGVLANNRMGFGVFVPNWKGFGVFRMSLGSILPYWKGVGVSVLNRNYGVANEDPKRKKWGPSTQ